MEDGGKKKKKKKKKQSRLFVGHIQYGHFLFNEQQQYRPYLDAAEGFRVLYIIVDRFELIIETLMTVEKLVTS